MLQSPCSVSKCRKCVYRWYQLQWLTNTYPFQKEFQNSSFSKDKLCVNPQTVNGSLVNREGYVSKFFVSGENYTIQCFDGFVSNEEDMVWSCVKGDWESGKGCVLCEYR